MYVTPRHYQVNHHFLCDVMAVMLLQVFSASQEREAKRLNHFKEMLFGIHKCLDISENAE